MKALTREEAEQWCAQHDIGLDARGRPILAGKEFQVQRFRAPGELSKSFWLATRVESFLEDWKRCVLWITEWGIWESSENWHLFYRLRQSYGESRLVEEAPCHLFQGYEKSDLINFIQLGLMAGWDFSLVTDNDYSRVFVSHDEWIECASAMPQALETIAKSLTPID